jgi:uncharacterized membrane protein YphA (DoxX/SURF4 family)
VTIEPRTVLLAGGRAALAGIFVTSGIDGARNPTPRSTKAEELGIPYPEHATRLNGATMALAGAALGLGVLSEWAAAVLIGCLVPTTLAGHAYWKIDDPQARIQQRTQVLKNLGLAGGLAAVIAAER